MSAADRAMALMRSHGSITQFDFLPPTLDGGKPHTRLAARIGELRDAGHHIETVYETTPGGARVARYFLRGEPTAVSGAVAASHPPGTDSKPAATAPETPADTLFDVPGATASPYDEDVAA